MSIFKELIRGAEEDRTPDPLLAKQVLSQLSYSPKIFLIKFGFNNLDSGGPKWIRTTDPSLIRAVL